MLDARDMPTVRAIARQAARDNNRFSAFVMAVVDERAVPDADAGYRRRKPPCEETPRESADVHHQEGTVAANGAPRHGSGGGPAAARRDGAGQTLLGREMAAGRRRKSRFTGIEMVHGSAGSTEYGTANHLWTPTTDGRRTSSSPKILKPLEPFRDYLTVVSSTDCAAADPFTAEEVGADHFRSSAVFLTAAHPKQTEGSDIRNGTSIDQLYAAEVRPGHAAAVDPAVHREPRFVRHLRLQLQLRLHGHDQLGRRRRPRCR